MRFRRPFRMVVALMALLAPLNSRSLAEAPAAKPLNVVASFSILGDLAARIGGDDIVLHVLVGSASDTHVYRPTPHDAGAIADADVLVLNGLGFEGWLERMGEASGFDGITVIASQGIAALPASEEAGARDDDGDGRDHERDQGHGGMDPHAWQSLANAKIYVSNIAKAFSDADPANIEDYKARAARLIAEISELELRTREAIAAIPEERRRIITSHDAFGYFEHEYGVTFLAAAGIANDAEPDPRVIAALIDEIRKQRVTAIFIENLSDNRLIGQIAEETGVAIGGTLYSDSLSGPDGPATSYLAMFAHNVDALVTAMRGVAN